MLRPRRSATSRGAPQTFERPALGLMAPMSGAAGSAVGVVTTGLAATTGVSGRRTSEIGRFTESRGTAASSPTPGRPVAVVADDCVNEMPDDAVYPPDRSIGVATSGCGRRLI